MSPNEDQTTMLKRSLTQASRAQIEGILQEDGVGTRIARRKARSLARSGSIGQCDAKDFEQALRSHIATVLGRRGQIPVNLERFISRVVRRKALNLLRDRRAAARDPGPGLASLHRVIAQDGEGHPIILAETLAEGDDRRVGRRPMHSASDLTLDLSSVVAALDPFLQKICEYLKSFNRQETASKLGISPGKLDSHIRRIRGHFEKFGLRGYA